MLWLVASDIHGDSSIWKSIYQRVHDNSAISAVILCGDLTNLGVHRTHEVDLARHWMGNLGKLSPVYYVLGNHDLGLENRDFECLENVKCLEGRVTDVTGKTLYGVVDTPCFDAPYMATRWHKMNSSYEHDESLWNAVPKVDVLVTHGPPFQCLDWCGRAVGSLGQRDYIQRTQPQFVFTGHIHEQSRGVERIGSTTVMNLARYWAEVELTVFSPPQAPTLGLSVAQEAIGLKPVRSVTNA